MSEPNAAQAKRASKTVASGLFFINSGGHSKHSVTALSNVFLPGTVKILHVSD